VSADYNLKPYRVDWRYSLQVVYCLVKEFDSHEDARDTAAAHVKKFEGECRVISQHVIERVKK
jgi:hypothetical protein